MIETPDLQTKEEIEGFIRWLKKQAASDPVSSELHDVLTDAPMTTKH